jgi:regulator of protease activity HflC (stomatin/prohibitin superfamily)
MEQFPLVLIAVIIVLIWLFISLNVLREYERGVIFRIGRLMGEPKGPGLIWVIWPIDRIVRVSLRTITMDVPTQDVITKDNVSVKVALECKAIPGTPFVLVCGKSLCESEVRANY